MKTQPRTVRLYAICGPHKFIAAKANKFAIPGGRFMTEMELQKLCKDNCWAAPRYVEEPL